MQPWIALRSMQGYANSVSSDSIATALDNYHIDDMLVLSMDRIMQYKSVVLDQDCPRSHHAPGCAPQPQGAGVPWLYYDEQRYNVSYWLPRVESSVPVLNRDGVFLPFGVLQTPSSALQSWLGSAGHAFVRPDSGRGRNIFTGFVAAVQRNGALDLRLAHQTRLLDPDELCYVSPAQSLPSLEWRFWIVGRKVVAWTPYSWGEQPAWLPSPAVCLAVAEAMAGNSWQPDIAYVADVVETSFGAALVEINAASTSGVYAVPFCELFSALRDAASREHAGDLAREI